MAHLTVGVLGELQVLIEDVPVSLLESDKVRALLVYLVVEAGRAHRRDTLIGLLWPDCSEGAARHNLSQALFNLRLALGDHFARPPYLLISRDALQFNQESDYSLDLDQFNANFSAWEKDREDVDPSDRFSLFEEMVRLYRGEFLRQFFLGESAEFDEWILVQREALHQRAMTVLTTLANGYEQQEDFETARRYAIRQLELDPWREEAHCQVMRLLAVEGQRSAALAQYENCRKVLAEELGVEPSSQTRELYEQIRLGTLKHKTELPTRVSSAPIHNLPVSLTPFIGREQELADLARLIADPECRCITFTGPGGIGKTRLALQAANQHAYEFAQGSAFIPLASVGSLDAVIPAIANGIGFAFYGPTDPKIQLLKYLRDKQMLLVVDNVEHLLVAGPQQDTIADLLIEILQSASQVKLLVTSLEVLNLQGEWSFEVRGLAFPGVDQMDRLDKYSAVTLFVQRARRTRPGFELNAANKPGVIRICQLVEGLPLAIELAAAWIRILSSVEIANEIETSQDFLNAQVRDLPERHRSMQAVFDHSWHMLTEEERHVLCRMSVFHGGFTRDAAEAVAGSGLALLSALVAKSFLRRTREGRYTLHELIRKYVADHLAEVPEEEGEARDRHSDYYMNYVARLEDKFKSAEQLQARTALDANIDNIRAGWRWAVRRGHIAMMRKPIRSLWCYYDMRGWYQEAEASYAWAVDEISTAVQPDYDIDVDARFVREYMRAMLGWFCLRRGKLQKADLLLQSSIASLRAFATGIELVDVLYYVGAITWMNGDYPRARAYFIEGLATAEKIGTQWDVGLASIGMGIITQTIGEYEEANQHWQRALDIYGRLGDQRGMAFVLNFSSIMKRTIGAYVEAQTCLRKCLSLSESVGDRATYGMALSQLGLVTQALGDNAQAIDLLNESVPFLRELGEFWSLLHALISLGVATLSIGDYATSHAAYSEALTMAWERQSLPEVLEALAGLARWSAQQGEQGQALVTAFFVLNHPAATEQTKEASRLLRVEIERSLSPDEIVAAQQLAGSKDLEEHVHQFLAGI